MKSCLNCDQPISLENKYCAHCGQKTAIGRLSVISLIKDFLSNLFNLENKIWSTLRDLFVPAKFTLAYIAGKRINYYNPLRIFLVVLFTFFTLFLLNIRAVSYTHLTLPTTPYV